MTKAQTAHILTYCGIIPFALCALIPLWRPDFLGLEYARILLGYGAVIASFIAGIHWGIYLFKEAPLNLFIHSNIVALLAWSALLIPPAYGTLLLLFCFLYLFGIDHRLFRSGCLEAWYMRMRRTATIVVILTLLLSLAA